MNIDPLHSIEHSVDCLIPAAGLSSRMGGWKMMLPFGKEGQTILDCSIANALNVCRQVILITGYRGDELAQRYQNNQCIRVVHNPDFHKGLFTSIQTGLKNASTEYVFISHGDMPLINGSIYDQIWSQRQTDVLFPTCNGTAGHPVLLHKSSFSRVLKSPANSRMKDILISLPHRFIEFESSDIHLDIDTQDVYQRIIKLTDLQ